MHTLKLVIHILGFAMIAGNVFQMVALLRGEKIGGVSLFSCAFAIVVGVALVSL